MVMYIIEHLEEKMYDWCLIEYKHISSFVGKENVWFTNVKSSQLGGFGKVSEESVRTLNLKSVCILDPDATKELTPKEALQFNYFVFGGILGDNPPRQRTTPELTEQIPHAESRHLGNKQMATDNAVYVVKQIVGGRKMSELEFKDDVEIELAKNESTVLPYRYIIVDGKPLVCTELIAKMRKGF